MNAINKNITRLVLALCLITLVAGCDYDNFEEPAAVLEGNVVYEGQPVGVRTNGPQLELWQDGYALDKNIPVYIAQDGSYSVSLFNGEYKMVVKEGGPWVPELNDTIVIRVNGRTEFDVPVTPYFTVNNESFQVNGNSVTVNFTIEKIVETTNLQSVNIYFGTAVLTDQNKNEYVANVDIGSITTGQPTTVSIDIPEHLQGAGYLFARIGVRSTQANEFYYSHVEKIEL
ncbi:DUF3823 domain-containing protein [Sinomicrobium pectinilyticum]|uniref:DUF3823 domain-containing protein n=1 Tax=Sinomicrobium pectinilyticum TaxID=1084421 RepID=A0A3N0EJ94_SINP1|nr:DUF3823 domain-containing protein [Sinomicrobium pectinilyticum]RNL87844.1 DUF3823 domain-containing protein [Sinomicrobium pectinilyticum]